MQVSRPVCGVSSREQSPSFVPQASAAQLEAFPTEASNFAIGFDRRDRARLHELWDRVLDSNRWSEGEMVQQLEEAWERWNGLPGIACSSWAGGALAALEFAGVRGETVLC